MVILIIILILWGSVGGFECVFDMFFYFFVSPENNTENVLEIISVNNNEIMDKIPVLTYKEIYSYFLKVGGGYIDWPREIYEKNKDVILQAQNDFNEAVDIMKKYKMDMTQY